MIAEWSAAQDVALPPVVITERSAAPQADITGFGDLPLREVPISATVIGSQQLQASGARRLADLTSVDASVSDAYNAPGYWDFIAIRGFTLDNRFNYRREGLPISAETVIPLDNKERIEILKGTSGIQAGTSAPGGLVNYVIKRPTAQPLREVRIEATQRASILGAVDISQRFGAGDAFGLRVNAAHERLRPLVRNLDGERSLLAAAADWRVSRDALLSAEIEWSRKSQPSQQAYSLLGNTLPAVPDPRLNLNNQPWSQPSDFDAITGTVRWEQAINPQWRWTAQVGRQSLKTNDRLAYAFGCGAENAFDRYCPDGSFDVYDFRSDNERRLQDAAQAALRGQVATGAVRHDLSVGVLASRVRNRFQQQAFNFVGSGNVQGTAVLPADPTLTDESTHRDETSLELSLQDAVRFNERITGWFGLRHTRLDRESVRTNGSRPTGYAQGLTTPWAALSAKIGDNTIAYASWGQGVESQVVPNRASQYSNAGVALPALKSRQWEAGVRGSADALAWQLAAFKIHRPMSNLDACARLGLTPCLGQYDGEAVHRGIEANATWQQAAWRIGTGVTWLDARRDGSVAEPGTNGRRPVNVPRWALRAQAAVRVAQGLELRGQLSHEGRRPVVPDSAITLPSWTRVDAALRFDARMAGAQASWTLGVENLLGRRYWRESPYQFGHVYLYPGAPRTVRLALSAAI